MTLVRADGSVRNHRVLQDPSANLFGGMDRNRLLLLVGGFMLGEFACFYAAFVSGNFTMWSAIAFVIMVVSVVYGTLLRRIGQRGGFYHPIIARRVRQQERYFRSAGQFAPVTKFSDSTES
jgi:hypothetical protein